MRVLWFTNDPMPAVFRRLGRRANASGQWMASLLESLSHATDLKLEVATAYPGTGNHEFEERGIRYFVIGQPKVPYIFFHCRQKDLETCACLVKERSPDIVHIHGVERFFGLMPARNMISAPCVISLQGFFTAGQAGFFGALSTRDILRSHRLIEIATFRGLFWLHRAFVRTARQEQEILAGPGPFLGRTNWDHAMLRSFNRTAAYYHVDEVLRPPFRRQRWDLRQCDRYTIVFTNAGRPHRGVEVLLRAMLIVKRRYPEATLRLAGHIGTQSGYDRFLRRTIADSGLANSVELLGYLDADGLARELRRAHAFAAPSFVDNSPNSLCEAMQVGIPCVATYTGGIPSLVTHEETGLLAPPGDAPLLADAILRIFDDDDLATRLGASARAVALERHAPERVVSQLLNAYEDVIARSRNETERRTELIAPALENRTATIR
jgi:glycosyltransferase involved in cell wall biosynthesis